MSDPRPPDLREYRARQRGRNRALGLVLAALVVLFFAITVVKIRNRAAERADAHQHAPAAPAGQR